MCLGLLIWIQAQPAHISKVVIAVVTLLFILAIALLVYFVRKLKTHEKVEDDWSLSRRSLFKESAEVIEGGADTESSAEESAAGLSKLHEELSGTQILGSGVNESLESKSTAELPPAPSKPAGTAGPTIPAAAPPEPQTRRTEQFASLRAVPPAPVESRVEPSSTDPTARQEGATEVLSTPRLVPPTPRPPAPRAPAAPAAPDDMFDAGIWSRLPSAQEPQSPPPPADATRELRSPAAETVEPPREARVQQTPPRAPFEAPVIAPVRHREPFEPPVVKPLTPRDQTAFLGTRPAAPSPAAKPDLFSPPPAAAPPAATTPLYSPGAPPRPADLAWSGSSVPGSGEPPPYLPAGGETPAATQWDPASASTGQHSRAQASHKPAGAVLGLPAEMSHAPLVLGTPVKARDDIGIGSLTGYGKVDKSGGRGGLVVLIVALILVAAGVLAYFYVPAFHDRVSSLLARSRGLAPDDDMMTGPPRAMIIPIPSPMNDQEIVTAKGTVQNLSKAPLESLTLDIQLKRRTGEIENRSLTLTPADLGPSEQGTYEFEYDGNSSTGFVTYSVVRLSSNGRQVRFSFPGQK